MSNELDTLRGGSAITIETIDGEKLDLLIKKASFVTLPQLVTSAMDDLELVKLYLGWTPVDLSEGAGQLDTNDEILKVIAKLTPEAGEAILKAGAELNDSAVVAFIDRSAKKMESPVAKALQRIGEKAAASQAGSSNSSAAE